MGIHGNTRRPVLRTTDGKLYSDARHEVIPVTGTTYSLATSSNAGEEADLMNYRHYPLEAKCLGCGDRVVTLRYQGGWEHDDPAKRELGPEVYAPNPGDRTAPNV